MIANPIIQRELISLLRTRKAFLLQIGLVAVLSLLVVLRWPSNAIEDLGGQSSQQVLRLFGYGLLVGLMLLAPVFPATSVVSERVNGTLALLFNSPMSRFSILFGKLVGVLGFTLLLIVLSFPAAAATYSMGGVGRAQLQDVYLILVLVALQYGTLGLLVSTYANTQDSALRMTYGVILLAAVVVLGPYYFFYGLDWVPPAAATALEWIYSVSPLAAMMETLRQQDVASRGVASATDVVYRFTIVAAISSGVFVVWTYLRMSQRIFDRARATGKVTDDRSMSIRAFRRVLYMGFFDPQRRTPLIAWWQNPVMIKEMRTRRFGRLHWLLRLAGACLVISLGLMYITTMSTIDWDISLLSGMMAMLQMALIVLMTPALASGLISSEIESRGWQLLQMTPLSAATILVGKLLSIILTLALVLIATLPAYIVLVLIPPDPPIWGLANVLVTLFLTSVFAVLFSAMVSSLTPRTSTATSLTYTLLVAMFGLTLMVWLGRGDPFSHGFVESALRLNPLAAALALLDVRGFQEYNLVPANWWLMLIGSGLSFLVLLAQTWRLTRPR